MENTKELDIEYLIKTNPFLLNSLNINIEKVGIKYLPYSIGIEIECGKSEDFNIEDFTNISNILDIDIDSNEQRFRIPNGINGLYCLYLICDKLKKNSIINILSGIHYHVDFSEDFYFDSIVNDKSFLNINKEFILNELDKWNYKGSYNKREIDNSHSWVRLNSEFKTFEFRIGEMSFDYEVLINRILHISLLCNILKNKYDVFNIYEYEKQENKEEEIKKIIKNRTINIYESTN